MARTARVQRRCDRDRTWIQVGDRYMRYVTFNRPDRPKVEVECVTCSVEQDEEMALGACLSYCHGTELCARPADHAGDHRCRWCGHA